jgi:hypothetical protein
MKKGDLNNEEEFHWKKNQLIGDACFTFEKLLEASTKKSRELPLSKHYPAHEIQQFMNFCAYRYYVESDMKRNPWASIKQIGEMAEEFNKYEFD